MALTLLEAVQGLRISELKVEHENRNLETRGNKSVLVDRLYLALEKEGVQPDRVLQMKKGLSVETKTEEDGAEPQDESKPQANGAKLILKLKLLDMTRAQEYVTKSQNVITKPEHIILFPLF